jgi:hypothetical protein
MQNVLIQPPAARVKVTAVVPGLASESYSDLVQRSWPWLAVFFALTLMNPFVGDLLSGLWYVVSLLVLALVRFAVSRRAWKRIHKTERSSR